MEGGKNSGNSKNEILGDNRTILSRAIYMAAS